MIGEEDGFDRVKERCHTRHVEALRGVEVVDIPSERPATFCERIFTIITMACTELAPARSRRLVVIVDEGDGDLLSRFNLQRKLEECRRRHLMREGNPGSSELLVFSHELALQPDQCSIYKLFSLDLTSTGNDFTSVGLLEGVRF